MFNVLPIRLLTGLAILVASFTFFSPEANGCTTPTGLTATSITSTSATLNWTAMSGSTSYRVRYRKTGTTTWISSTVYTNSKALTGLTPGTYYEWNVRSNCTGGNSSYAATVSFSTNCATPSGLSTTNITTNSAQLNWGTTVCDSFLVRYYVTSIPNTIYYKNVSPSTATSTTLTGLLSNTNYSWLIRTYCKNGSSGTYTSTMTFTTLSGTTCNTPTGLSATSITTSGATLNWTAVTGAASYNIRYRNVGNSTWTSTTATTTSKSITGLTASTNYEFQLQTVCTGGGTSSWSSSANFTTASSCNAPTGLGSSSITSSSATVSWSAASGALSYNVQYRVTGATAWTSTTSTTTSKSLTGLSPATGYQFQVQTVCSGGNSAWSSTGSFTTSNSSTLPVPDHIVVLIEENHGYSQIIGSASAPNINALANDPMSTLFTQMYGVEHPSQPNYLDLFSGSNQGITNNNTPSSHFTTANLARELINAGKTFVSYSQNLPSVGWDGTSSGKYMRKHNPIANWMGTGTNQVSSSLNQPFTAFPTNYASLPTVSFVIPDQDYDMHDGTIATGDSWFYTNLNGYVQWAKTHNSLFILIFDEDDGNYNNRIAMIFTGPMVKSGTVSTTYNHYNVLRTIEDMYGTTHAGNAASASAIHGCWLNGYKYEGAPESATTGLEWSVYPNPVSTEFRVSYILDEYPVTGLRLCNQLGQEIAVLVPEQGKGSHELTFSTAALGLKKGIYFLEMVLNDRKYLRKLAVTE